MTDERITKLPKWAQDAMRQQERKIAELEQRLADVPESPNTAVWLDPYGYHRHRARAVADRGEYVRFCLDGLEGYRWVDVRVAHDSGSVDVMASSGLLIECRASNTAGIQVQR